GDFDNDGATDLLITQNHGPAVLLKNEGGNKNNWLRLALKGLADNKSAIGTKVEIFSDCIRQKFDIYGSNGYLGQNSPYLTVGLGQAKQADVSACSGRRACCKMKSKSLATRSTVFLRWTAAAAHVQRCSHGMEKSISLS